MHWKRIKQKREKDEESSLGLQKLNKERKIHLL